ncbi:MAG: hypothetical protein JWN98_2712, partial [Abditibacteriota bacterium]|nr:hypothetical protein [Abditibacteriota bacterium]
MNESTSTPSPLTPALTPAKRRINFG